jgi:hypothetical protein
LACQTPASGPTPTSYRFPERFFVEQDLSLQSQHGPQELIAQLERKDGTFVLVLTSARSTMVLAKLTLKKGEKAELDYLAPVLKKETLPLDDIGEAIRFLYEYEAILRENDHYEVVDPENRWTYSWTQFHDEGGCLFPEDLKLHIQKAGADIDIRLRKVECPS